MTKIRKIFLIIAAIMGIVFFYSSSLNKPGIGKDYNDAIRVSDVIQIQHALEIHFDEHEDHPSDLKTLVHTGLVTESLLTDPHGESYGYKSWTQPEHGYCLGANLENRNYVSRQEQCELEGYNHRITTVNDSSTLSE